MVYPRTDAASAGHSRFGTDESGSDFLLPFDGEGATAEVDPKPPVTLFSTEQLRDLTCGHSRLRPCSGRLR
jgi:hypothetical protein